MPTTETTDLILTLFRAAVARPGVWTPDIIHGVIDQPEQFGEPCEHCADEDHTVTMNVYMGSLTSGDGVMLSGCAPCMVNAVAADADPEVTVQIETQTSHPAPPYEPPVHVVEMVPGLDPDDPMAYR